jgi:hypothetical protein
MHEFRKLSQLATFVGSSGRRLANQEESRGPEEDLTVIQVTRSSAVDTYKAVQGFDLLFCSIMLIVASS